jgi:hypothetical protein
MSQTDAQTESEQTASELQTEPESEMQESESAEQINTHINTFVSLAETVLLDGAKETLEAQGRDYTSEIETAVVFYQQWLSELPDEILSEAFAETKMSQYQLRQDIEQQLNTSDRAFLVQELKDTYRDLCIGYVRALFDRLDPAALVRADLEKADQAYTKLGDDWTLLLEQQWQEEQTALTSQGTVSEGTDGEEGQTEQSLSSGSIGDLLAVYKVYLLLQEYQQMDSDASDMDRYAALEKIHQAYLSLTDTQKLLASQNADLVLLLSQNNMWEDQTEQETELWDDYYSDGYGDYSDGVGYTASELQELIESKEREIKDCALDIREIELSVQQKQRIVDGKVVKSTLDGTVVSIGTLEGESDDDYFVKVTNQTGLYAKGSMNELSLESIHVGDRISGMMTDTGVSFTAVIKEIQEYPDADGSSSSWGWSTENTNASYYPFYALIEDTDGIEEGEAEIQLSDTLSLAGDTIYLEQYFVRTESDGKSYVYIQGPNGKLKKQYVKTGKTLYSWAIEIVSGLELTDKIAFPYGSNVQEGAQTKEVDMLEDAYM